MKRNPNDPSTWAYPPLKEGEYDKVMYFSSIPSYIVAPKISEEENTRIIKENFELQCKLYEGLARKKFNLPDNARVNLKFCDVKDFELEAPNRIY